jgi:hypothetical protein
VHQRELSISLPSLAPPKADLPPSSRSVSYLAVALSVLDATGAISPPPRRLVDLSLTLRSLSSPSPTRPSSRQATTGAPSFIPCTTIYPLTSAYSRAGGSSHKPLRYRMESSRRRAPDISCCTRARKPFSVQHPSSTYHSCGLVSLEASSRADNVRQLSFSALSSTFASPRRRPSCLLKVLADRTTTS